MAYEFHYTPTGTGVISGKEVLEQTEDAINDLGNTAISGVQEALDKAEQALTNSENAVDDAQTALNTANNAEGVAIQAQTDVGNLSGTVTNIGNRVTTAEGNITNLQGRMTTAEGNVTNLQGRMTTAEGNIGNLQTAVSTAQATANSAQQTATTARQQSYVFRYSSTALTPSSTNSNTLLDNTDNLKVGDKVIDSSGVIYSITAIDTANSTFTIGTALIDLAQDSDVVHKTGNETVGGQKTFSSDLYVANTDTTANIPNLNLRNYKAERGTTDSTFQVIQFLDKNSKALSLIESRIISNGNTTTNILCYNTNDSNNTVSGGVSIIKSKTDTNFAPNADNTVTCGRPLAKWSDVQTYKINGLTPSSLSLPSTTGVVDISSYITDLTGTANTYTVLVNGYIQFDVTGSSVEIDVTNGLSQKWIMTDPKGFIPVVSGAMVSIKVVGTAINNFKFIPCQGNI